MSKSDDKPTLPELGLVESKREFIETFFKRGAEFTEELMHENERLRFRVVQLEEERRSAGLVGAVVAGQARRRRRCASWWRASSRSSTSARR